METQFYTAPEVARILKLSRSLVYRLVSQGAIRALHVGKAVRISDLELQRFIDTSSGNPETLDSDRLTRA